MQTNQYRAHIPNYLIYHALHSRPLYTCFNHHKSSNQKTKDSPYVPELLELFKIENPKVTYSVFSLPSHGNHKKASCIQFLHVLTTLVLPCGALYNVACPPLSIQWQLSPDLLVSPYSSNNKAYILKHAVMSISVVLLLYHVDSYCNHMYIKYLWPDK